MTGRAIELTHGIELPMTRRSIETTRRRLRSRFERTATRDFSFEPLEAGSRSRWELAAGASVLLAGFFITMEWLFFATKPSFMAGLTFGENLLILLIAPAPLFALCLGSVLALRLASMISADPFYRKICQAAALSVPAMIAALGLLLMVDNFTLTVFEFGVQSTGGLFRLIYVVLVFRLGLAGFRFVRGFELKPAMIRHRKRWVLLTVALPAVSFAAALGRWAGEPSETPEGGAAGVALKRPNIVLLGGDGITAEHASIYGYERETTPYLNRFAADALVCDNAYSNAGATTPSVLSMLTGTLPTVSHLMRQYDVLRGRDQYRHLPGILRRHGYWTIQVTSRSYGDAEDHWLRNSFDYANFRHPQNARVSKGTARLLGQPSAYFVQKIAGRVLSRLAHIFYIRDMIDPEFETLRTGKGAFNDPARIEELIEQIEKAPEPFFAHIHLVSTHGPRFDPRKPLFSKGQEQAEDWIQDFYDDAILDFDEDARRLIEFLKATDRLDDTVFVVYSDHGFEWSTWERLLFFIRFPGGEHAGRLRPSAQCLDVAPTLLDYLGIEIPDWMGGDSLLSESLDPDRLLWAALQEYEPVHEIDRLSLRRRDAWFVLDSVRGELRYGRVEGHTDPFAEGEAPPASWAEDRMFEHLEENGFRLPHLKRPLPVREGVAPG